MTVPPMDVAVIGCGTAGASSALFLAAAGHNITVFEAVAEPGPVGAGIMIQPTGMQALAELGLLDEIIARGARVDRLQCVTRGRRTIVDLTYADVHTEAFGLGLHRGVLFVTLFEACRAHESIDVRCGVPIESLGRTGDNRSVIGLDGTDHGAFDLVIIADGADSQLRDDTDLTRRALQHPWGALWFIGDDPDGVFDDVLFQVVEGTGRMLGLLPSGLGPEGNTKKVSVFWSVRADLVEHWRANGLEPWRELLTDMEPRCGAVLDQIDSIEEVLFARYWDVVMKQWHDDGLVIIGDAAHATSPQLGQGANLALVDSMALSDALAEGDTLNQALDDYSRSRRDHLGYYQWATRFLTPFFQSDRTSLGWMRDLSMGIACRLPYVRTRMIRTMCGLERGVLLPDPLPMPELPKRLPAEASR